MNLIFTFLSHEIKALIRGSGAGKSIAMQIFVGIIIIYCLASAFLLGIMLDKLLTQGFPQSDNVAIFCSFILYYFLGDLVFRFFMQELPTLSVKPYLCKNIRKRSLVNFLNIRSVFHYVNLLPLILLLPFCFSGLKNYNIAGSIALALSIIGLTLFNNFLLLYLKRKSILQIKWFVGFFVGLLILATLDYFGVLPLSSLSEQLFLTVIRQPLLSLVFIGVAVWAWWLNTSYLRHNLYIEEKISAGVKTSASYSWLSRWGATGEMVALDLKLIFRNKRPRSVVLMSSLLFLYGFIFYRPEYMNLRNGLGYLVFAAIFVTGSFIINYGNFLFAWQSSHFDGLMANNISIRQYIKSKLLLFSLAGTVSFLLTSFYAFIDWRLLPLQLAAFLFNVGCTSIFSVYLATYSNRGIDLGKSATFNYQGTGATQWIYALLVLLVPVAIYAPLAILFHYWVGVAALGGIGLISWLMQPWWIEVLYKEFKKRKYIILDGFREK